MFVPAPDFDERTRGGERCSSCGSTKQAHHTQVWRGEMIDLEGFYDVCEACVLQLVDEVGGASPEKYNASLEMNDALLETNDRLNEENRMLKEFRKSVLSFQPPAPADYQAQPVS